MCYIIDRVKLLRNGHIEKTALLINQNKIEFMRQTMDNIKFMRMDLSSYLLTPGFVMLDFSLHSLLPFKQYKHIFTEYLAKGCTTLLTVVDIAYEKELLPKLKERRHLMINSPIDYYIGIKLSLKSLSPSMIRKCKQQNISIIFVELNKSDKLDSKSWGWIRDAMFSNPITLIPYTEDEALTSHKKQKVLQNWINIMKENRLSFIDTFLEQGKPLPRDVLMRVGVYPEKGDIRVGAQLNYNLFHLDHIHFHTDGKPMMDFNSLSPAFTFHHGKLINVNGNISFQPGIGEECFIPISGRFIPQSASF